MRKKTISSSHQAVQILYDVMSALITSQIKENNFIDAESVQWCESSVHLVCFILVCTMGEEKQTVKQLPLSKCNNSFLMHRYSCIMLSFQKNRARLWRNQREYSKFRKSNLQNKEGEEF